MSSLWKYAVMLFLVVLITTPAAAQQLAATVTEEAQADAQAGASQQEGSPPPVVVEYSDAYRLRARIHRVASFATLPLFGTEAILGQSLYSNPTGAKRDAHLAVASGIGALFVVNTVTGVWNLVEARKDPNHRAIRWVHGLLMLGADGGFLATAATGPERERFGEEGSRATHRAIAFTSIGAATAGYLIMLLGSH